jgi:hypothetical protein
MDPIKLDLMDYLNQRSVWIKVDGNPEKISGMEPLHRRNAARWMIKNATLLLINYQMVEMRRTAQWAETSNGYDLRRTLANISRPEQWIKGTTLFLALTDGDDLASGYALPRAHQ